MASILFFNLNVLLGFAILVITYLAPDTRLLARASIENGPYEVATAVILLTGSIWLFRCGLKRLAAGRDTLMLLACFGMALLCFVGAGEEISWGQHWLRFEAGEFFKTHNHQQEANLHNLIPAVAFSTAINVVIYGGFTLLPLLHWANPGSPVSRQLHQWQLARFIPSLDVALMLTLANCFHAWLIPATYSDTAVLLLCWLLAAGVMLWQKDRVRGYQWFMLTLSLAGFLVCLWVRDIFRHHNMQYELRECFTAFVIVIWAAGWAGQPTRLQSPS